jgi:hypothetical protein
MGERFPLPVVLEKGEREVRRVEGVVLKGREGTARGPLLLTNLRLIFNGGWDFEEPAYFEWSLGDILGCDVKKQLFDKKKLLVAFKTVLFKLRKVQKKHTLPETGVYAFTDVDQPEVLKSEIMKQIETYKKAPPPKAEKCPSCGAEIPAEATFCPACGGKVR